MQEMKAFILCDFGLKFERKGNNNTKIGSLRILVQHQYQILDYIQKCAGEINARS
jgi:hypothetical protein